MSSDARGVVLNVDDDDAGRYATSRILRRAGFEVREARTGAEAVRLAAEGPDLVLLDVNLPDRSGFEVCRQLKADPATARIPVLHLSATFVRGQDRVAGLEGGADAYLAQPVDPEELVATVRALLRLRRAEDEARRAADAWQATFEAIGDGIGVLDAEGRIVRANRALDELIGGGASPVGRLCAELCGTGAEHPCPFERVLASGARQSLERRFGERWLGIAIDPMFDAGGTVAGGVLVVSDLTDRVAAEGRVQESERRYRALFDAHPIPLWVYDLETLRFLAVNEAAIEQYGWSRDEFLASTLEAIRPPDDVAALHESVESSRRRSGREFSGPWRHVTRDGRSLEVEIVSHDLTFGARPARLVAALDVTSRRALEAQLLHAQKLDAVGRLAGGVAHDFNNMLQAMLASVQLARLRRGGEAGLQVALGELEAQIRSAAGLSRQLLLFSRREVARPETLDLNQLVTDAGKMLRRVVRENIHFRVVLAAAPLAVEVDRGQLEQVLVNLVVNAADAMPRGGELSVRTAVRGSGEACVEVRDTGCGIPVALLDRIFDPFFTTKPPGQGSGLGLSVVHGIVSSYGGRVEVESSEGEGALFRVVLPLGAGLPVEPPPAANVFERLPRGGGRRILVVEDEEGARLGLCEMLRALEYEVVEAADGEAAQATPETSRPAMLLTDVMLPGITGVELAERLQERWPELRVILMSGYTEDERIRERLTGRLVRFLAKPFDVATLARELHDAVAATPATGGDR
ncbi:MAG: response regulator [Acidobacteriota bacterium]